jgi:hypothetical protein
VIINFAIENDHGVAIFGKDRLIAGRQINNLEASCTKGACSRSKYSLLVWSAMNQSIRCFPYTLLIRVPVLGCESNNAAHVSMPLSRLAAMEGQIR